MIWGCEGEGPWLQRTKSNGREKRCAVFFKRTHKKREEARGSQGLWVRELKFKMEIYELGI